MKKNIPYFAAAAMIVAAFFSTFVAISFAAFSDVSNINPYYDAINYAQQNNIASGYPDGTFRPYNSINRAEFTKVVYNAEIGYNPSQDRTGTDTSLSGIPFSDAVAGQWYIPYLRKALLASLISGYPDGTFKPANNISFVEAAKIIVRAFGYQTQPNAIWYMPYVQQLANLNAIPTTITSYSQPITRGEMVEIIYRLKNKITSKPSQNAQLSTTNTAGSAVTTVSYTSNTPSTSENIGTASEPMVGSCTVFPADNPWNTDVSNYPVDPNSDNYIASIGASGHLHPDFGGNGQYGIPYNIVGAAVNNDPSMVNLGSVQFADQSDPGPYPIPANPKIEPDSDSHLIVLDEDNCDLYELWQAQDVNGTWDAGSAAEFNLTSDALRPDGWTSADAAGLPIYPGLVKYDEVAAGAVNHALRFTVDNTQDGFIHPATHEAGSGTDPNLPPMGLRLRLKANYDISGFTGESKVILEGLKKYGMILADNGSNWYISGSQDPRWNDDDLNQLKSVPGSAFEVLQTGPILHSGS